MKVATKMDDSLYICLSLCSNLQIDLQPSIYLTFHKYNIKKPPCQEVADKNTRTDT